jgi:hypothetical protein
VKTILSRRRVLVAYAIAIATDVIQIGLGPLGLIMIDEVLDIVAAILITGLIGFHYLLLPTVVIEAVPVVSFMPSWTACTFAVVALRKRGQREQTGASTQATGSDRTPPFSG